LRDVERRKIINAEIFLVVVLRETIQIVSMGKEIEKRKEKKVRKEQRETKKMEEKRDGKGEKRTQGKKEEKHGNYNKRKREN
jgi:hypothetical protein